MADRATIEKIKENLDIVSLIREYVPDMKKSGKNYFILCPFHNEKTPSCAINEDIQRFKCFGCGASGDVITFIEKMEGVEFPRAIEIAANKAGVTIPKNFQNNNSSKEYILKKKLYEVNHLTAEFFHYILLNHPKGKKGLKYAKKRGFTKKLIKKFLIGYAPEGFENLKKFLTKKGYQEKKLVEWSLLISKNNRIYDKFRKRLMFPIFNHLGDIVGFSGRVIDNNDMPKYLNSAVTTVYKKSEILYGLFQAKDSIRKNKFAILVEGNIDVPSAFKIGYKNTVAPLGTSLTSKQLKLLKRYTDTIYFAFDTDPAGEKAMIRSHEIAENLDFSSKAINLDEYTDLDELISSNAKLAKQKIENAEPIIDNLIKRFSNRLELGEAEGKSKFVKLILKPLSQIEDKIEQTHYIQQISSIVNVKEGVIWEKLNKNISKSSIKNQNKNEKLENSQPPPKEQYLIAMLLQNPNLEKENFDIKYIQNSKLVSIYKQLKNADNKKEKINNLNDAGKKLASELLMMNIGNFASNHELKNAFCKELKYLEKTYLKNQLTVIKNKIKTLESKGDDVSDLLKKQNTLIAKLKDF